jgi:hypothetical protein
VQEAVLVQMLHRNDRLDGDGKGTTFQGLTAIGITVNADREDIVVMSSIETVAV